MLDLYRSEQELKGDEWSVMGAAPHAITICHRREQGSLAREGRTAEVVKGVLGGEGERRAMKGDERKWMHGYWVPVRDSDQ